jgi:hypothetical protein
MTNRLVTPLLALAFGAALATSAPAQDAPSPADAGFPDLVAGLRAIPGNLGVETARTANGKNVIFAWFEDKEALLRWYHGEMHREVQDRFFPDRPPHTPLAHVPDGTGPILAVASITMAEQPQFEETTSLPISQIAIELYTPLPGGLSLGGTFAPEGMEVPHMIQLGPYGEHEHPDER